MLIAEVCANVQVKSIDQTYTYKVPEKLKFLSAGWRVIVPFGGRKKIDGFVMNVREVENPDFDFELKEISDVIDDEAWFTPEMITAATRLAEFYLCPLAQAMSLFMPGKSGKKISPKFEEYAKLIRPFSPEEFKRSPARLKLLNFLSGRGEVSLNEIRAEKFSSKTVKDLEQGGYIEISRRRIFRDSYANFPGKKNNFDLNEDQLAAVDTVKKFVAEKKFGGFLLHGVTGSGKTQVYIEIAKSVRKSGRRVIILVPEISLTAQTVRNFKAYFPDLTVIHSRLSIDERSDAFHKIRNGESGVVIGARSALFTPIDNLGLIVMDEEQDFSYKQDESPRYHARIIAEEFARVHNAAIIFGSATPSLETYYRAKISGELFYLNLPHRALNQPLPTVECVDMRKELKDGNRSVLSRSLKKLLAETLKSGGQAILLLNRRGYSTFVMCRECGEVIRCPDCGLSMTYHADGSLKCHHCDIEQSTPKICPNCGSKYIKFFGTGTQKLEQFLKTDMPDARVLRMDRDTTAQKFGHRKILSAFERKEFDILFGTQMVAKGHDIQNVTAVGILSADASLNIPNFRAAEQCFMLITQAAGRAGRADIPGKVIVQAYEVEAPAVVFGCRQDYEGFFKSELPGRKELFFPPFSRLVKLIFRNTDEEKAKMSAENTANILKAEFSFSEKRHEVRGPVPAMIANYRGEFRFLLVIKTEDLNEVRRIMIEHDLQKRNDVLIDIDPISTD